MLDRTTPPPIQEIESIRLLPTQQILFPNNFQVYYLHSSESEIIQLSLLFKAGYMYQNKKLLTDTFASLVTSGTINHSSKQIAEWLEYYGVFYSVEPAAIYTKFQFTFLKKKITQVLPIVEDIIKYADFPESEIELYIKNHIEQYQTQIKNVATLAQWNYSKIIYGNNHPLNKLHTPDDYKDITRDDCLYVYTTHIHPNNGLIFISGNIENRTLKLLENSFGKEEFHQTQHIFSEEVPPVESYEQHIYIQQPEALQSAIRVGTTLPITHKTSDYFDFVIANTLLGGYFGSRLMSVIREEKGYTYGIYSGLIPYNTFSVLTISSEVKAEHTQACIDEIIHQIQILQQNEPDAEELEIVKNYMSGEILDNTDGILKQDNVWKMLITRKLDNDYYNRFLDRIKSIQPSDISNVVKKYIDVQQLKKVIAGKI